MEVNKTTETIETIETKPIKVKCSKDFREGTKSRRVVEMWEQGIDPSEMYNEMDFRYMSDIYNILNRAGVRTGRKHTLNHINPDEVVRMKESGLTARVIAEKLGIGASSVYKIIDEYGKTKCITVNRPEEQQLPIPPHEKKVKILPVLRINGTQYVDIMPMIFANS